MVALMINLVLKVEIPKYYNVHQDPKLYIKKNTSHQIFFVWCTVLHRLEKPEILVEIVSLYATGQSKQTILQSKKNCEHCGGKCGK